MGWGRLFSDLINRILPANQQQYPDKMVMCLAGISITGIISFSVSVFTALNGVVHLFICVPAIVYLFFKSGSRQFFSELKAYFSGISMPGWVLITAGILLMACLNAAPVVHPDTLMYHAQSIKWMEEYPSVPGLAHLSNELGLQSLFFANQALFRFQFISSNDFLFLNGCVASWFIIFLAGMGFRKDDLPPLPIFLPVFLLLAFTMLSWTQLRLTAASASPDFIVTIYLLSIFYLFYNSLNGPRQWHSTLYCVLFISAVIAIKLSAAPVAIIALLIFFDLIRKGYRNLFLLSLALAAITAITLVLKNAIASGFLFYPMTIADILEVDWKQEAAIVNNFRQYIYDYAVLADQYQPDTDLAAISFPIRFSIWWKQLYLADRIIMVLIPASLLLTLTRLIAGKVSFPRPWWIIFIVSLTGIIIWMLNAPAFRFGTGFLLPFLFLNLPRDLLRKLKMNQNLARLSGLGYSLVTGLYLLFRLFNHSSTSELVYPAGLTKHPVSKVACDTNTFMQTEQYCGFTALPCIHTSCDNIRYRGPELRNGFKAR